MAEKHLTFDSKIKELQERRSELDVTVLESKREEYSNRIVELLTNPVQEWKGEEAYNEMRECYAKVKELDEKIKQMPADAWKIVEELDAKIAEYEASRERVRGLQLYRDTEEWISNILWEDNVYIYAKETNNEELKNKLERRRLTEEEYMDYKKKMYGEMLLEAEKSWWDSWWKKVDVEQDQPKVETEEPRWETWEQDGGNQETSLSESNNQLQKKKKVVIERPRISLSRLNVDYDIIDKVILPTKWDGPRIRKSVSKKKSEECESEYQNKIGILFDKVLTPNHWFKSDDYKVISWQEPKNMVRKSTYIVVAIPDQDKMIILNNGYWEATFLCDEILDEKIYTSLSKEELLKDNNLKKHIKKLKFEKEDDRVNEILKWLGKDVNGEQWEKSGWVSEHEEEAINPNTDDNDKSDDKESKEVIEKRKATPKELFFSFEKYIKFFLEIDDLKDASKDQIQQMIDLLKIPDNYEDFCNVSKKEYLNDAECTFPSSLSEFVHEICPVDINDEQLILILQSNHMEEKEFKDMFRALCYKNKDKNEKRKYRTFYPFWSHDYIKRTDIDDRLKDEVIDLYRIKRDMVNWLDHCEIDREGDIGKAHFKKVNSDIADIEMRIIDTIYPHLKNFYTIIYELYSFMTH